MAQLCFNGLLLFTWGGACPDDSVKWVGKVWWDFTIGFTFWFSNFDLGKVTLGIAFGTEFRQPEWCWWEYHAAWGANDAWWVWRRRSIRKCSWGQKTCHPFIKGWLSITIWIAKVVIELWWWRDIGETDVYFYFYVETIWAWDWEWAMMWGKRIMTIK